MTVQQENEPDGVRSLTVIPPWSLAIVGMGKVVENRTQNVAGRWRGRILILSSRHAWDPAAAAFLSAVTGTAAPSRARCCPGHYIGAADLVDVHRSDGRCCEPWGEPQVWHLALANAVSFAKPIPATGHLGLRRVTSPGLIRAGQHVRRHSLPGVAEHDGPRV